MCFKQKPHLRCFWLTACHPGFPCWRVGERERMALHLYIPGSSLCVLFFGLFALFFFSFLLLFSFSCFLFGYSPGMCSPWCLDQHFVCKLICTVRLFRRSRNVQKPAHLANKYLRSRNQYDGRGNMQCVDRERHTHTLVQRRESYGRVPNPHRRSIRSGLRRAERFGAMEPAFREKEREKVYTGFS